jgi:hypothetical protein
MPSMTRRPAPKAPNTRPRMSQSNRSGVVGDTGASAARRRTARKRHDMLAMRPSEPHSYNEVLPYFPPGKSHTALSMRTDAMTNRRT